MNKLKSVGIALLALSLIYTNVKLHYLSRSERALRHDVNMLFSEHNQSEFRFHMVMEMWAEEMERVAREVVEENK